MNTTAREAQIFPLMRPKNLSAHTSEDQEITEKFDIEKDKNNNSENE